MQYYRKYLYCENVDVFYFLCKNTLQWKYADRNTIVVGKYIIKATVGQIQIKYKYRLILSRLGLCNLVA